MYTQKVLDESRIKVLEKLKPLLPKYPICGGTGLALHIGHRISYNFDLFSTEKIPNFFDKKITDLFPESKVIINTTDELTLFTNTNVKITFLHYPFPNLEDNYQEDGIFTGSLKDLIANKVYVLGRRAEIRDYIDIYFILKKYTLEEILSYAKQKYGELISEKTVLGQLTYFEDLNFNDKVFTSLNIDQQLFIEELINIVRDKIN